MAGPQYTRKNVIGILRKFWSRRFKEVGVSRGHSEMGTGKFLHKDFDSPLPEILYIQNWQI